MPLVFWRVCFLMTSVVLSLTITMTLSSNGHFAEFSHHGSLFKVFTVSCTWVFRCMVTHFFITANRIWCRDSPHVLVRDPRARAGGVRRPAVRWQSKLHFSVTRARKRIGCRFMTLPQYKAPLGTGNERLRIVPFLITHPFHCRHSQGESRCLSGGIKRTSGGEAVFKVCFQGQQFLAIHSNWPQACHLVST